MQWGQQRYAVLTERERKSLTPAGLDEHVWPAYYLHCFLWEYVAELKQSKGTNEEVSGRFSMNCTRHLASDREGCNKIQFITVYNSLQRVSPLQSCHRIHKHCNDKELSICCVTSLNNNVLHLAVTKHIQFLIILIINILMMMLVAINHLLCSPFIFLPKLCWQHFVLTLSFQTLSHKTGVGIKGSDGPLDLWIGQIYYRHSEHKYKDCGV